MILDLPCIVLQSETVQCAVLCCAVLCCAMLCSAVQPRMLSFDVILVTFCYQVPNSHGMLCWAGLCCNQFVTKTDQLCGAGLHCAVM